MGTVGQWRATYTPGDWLVLCGPTSVVVIEPPGAGWSDLVAELWRQVLASSSLVDLANRLAAYGLDTMPSFGALFWTPDGMRSLVRGSVVLLDPATDRVVASGSGIQTWAEVGLEGLRRIRVATGGDAAAGDLQLPLVVGAVRAAAVLLDAAVGVQSPQQLPQSEPSQSVAPVGTEPTEVLASPGAGPVAVTEVLRTPGSGHVPSGIRQDVSDAETALLAPPLSPGPPGPPSGRAGGPAPSLPLVPVVLCPYGHPSPPGSVSCHSCGAPVTDPRPREVPQPVVAVLRSSVGDEAALDRPVLVGRAPTARGERPVRLLPLPSPAHDISRSHLVVEPVGWQVQVTDLHSTNGTLLVESDGERRSLPPGQPVLVRMGARLELAEGISVVVEPR